MRYSYGEPYLDEKYQVYTPRYVYNRIKSLGYYNMNIFYELHKELFFNLVTLFELNGYTYDFLFPYLDEKPYKGFDPDSLQIKKTEGKSFVQKNINENKTKWYDIVEEPNPTRLKRFTKLLRSRKASCESFRAFEPLSSTTFFNKSINAIKVSNRSTRGYSNKSVNRNSNKNLSRFSNKGSNRNSNKSFHKSSNKNINRDTNNNNNNSSLFAIKHSKTISQ